MQLGQPQTQQTPGQQPMYQPVPLKRNPYKWICLIKHDWSNWETYKVTYGPSPLERMFGVKDYDAEGLMQIRQCARCGVTQKRNV